MARSSKPLCQAPSATLALGGQALPCPAPRVPTHFRLGHYPDEGFLPWKCVGRVKKRYKHLIGVEVCLNFLCGAVSASLSGGRQFLA